MANLTKATGKGTEISIKGKSYKVYPLTINDLAEFESYIISQRISAYLNAVKGLDVISSEKAETINEIASQELTDEERDKNMRTVTGARFVMWRALKRGKSELELIDMGELIDTENIEEIIAVLEAMGAQGKDEESKNKVRGARAKQ